ncbi:MAG: glycosyltransferase [Candidatus Thermoplasmatota archaeon]|nr:glycosyltransferase [Candidatus Thermoplasmatota archaeon]
MANVAMLVSNRHDPDPRVQKEAEALVKAGHDVCIYAYDRLHEIEKQNERINGVEIKRIRTEITPYGKIYKTGKGLRKFRAIVKNELRNSKIDIVHCHDQDTCAVGLWWKKQGKGKFVFDAHDLYWTWLLLPNPKSIIRKVGALILKRRDKIYAQNSDLLIVATEGIGNKKGYKEIYKKWGKDSITIMNAENQYSDSWTYPNNFTIGYFGNLRDYQMFKQLIEAILLIDKKDRPSLRISGSGAESEKIKKMFETYPEINCKITGRYEHSQLKDLMDECSIQYCVYTSKRGNIQHTIPAKLFSSIACGKKGIVNSNSLTSEVCKKNNWGWDVDDSNTKEISKLILKLKNEWDSVSDKNSLFPFGNFKNDIDWNSQAEKLVDAYKSL